MTQNIRRSVGGVTVGDAWRYNNPDLVDSIHVPFDPSAPDYNPDLHWNTLDRLARGENLEKIMGEQFATIFNQPE